MKRQICDENMGMIINRAWEDTSASPDFKERLRNRLIFQNGQSSSNHIFMPRIAFALGGIATLALTIYGLWLPTILDFH